MKLRADSHIIKFYFLLHSKHTSSSLRRPTFKGEKLWLFTFRVKRGTEIHGAGKNTDYNVLKHVVHIFIAVSQRSSDMSLK